MTNTVPREIDCPSCGQMVRVLADSRTAYLATHNLLAPSKPAHLKPECSASRTRVYL